MFQILSKKELAQGTMIFNEILAPKIALKAKPGQFIILKINETGERIPLTISNTDINKGTISIIYQVIGKTTNLLKNLKEKEYIQDIAGPLGRPTNITKIGTILCIGGGTGIAVLYPIIKYTKQIGNKVFTILGARNKNMLILKNEIAMISDKLFICTDDGSYGHHGFVTDVLKNQLNKLNQEIKKIICIGPVPMMKACCKITMNFNIPTIVSLNAIMIDGTGMCGCCRVTVNGKTNFTCVDGPDFNGHQVDFDGLSTRLSTYYKEEKEAMKNYKDHCICSN